MEELMSVLAHGGVVKRLKDKGFMIRGNSLLVIMGIFRIERVVEKVALMNNLTPLRGGSNTTDVYRWLRMSVSLGYVKQCKGRITNGILSANAVGGTSAWYALTPAGIKLAEAYIAEMDEYIKIIDQRMRHNTFKVSDNNFVLMKESLIK